MEIRKAKRGKKGRGRGPRYWVIAVGAAGAIVAFTVGNSHRMVTAYAAERHGVLEVGRSDDQRFAAIDFNIPAGTLRSVLDAYQKKTGIEVSVSSDPVLDLPSPGVVGSFTAEQALKRILEGTGINYAFSDSRHARLILEAESANVEIVDTGAHAVASTKYTEPLRDTPQTISVITEDVMRQQGATTLRDVLSNVPGITLTAGEGGAPAGDSLTIRGFSARNDIYVDGVRDLGAQSRDPFNLEQVEVVKGPSSTFTGRGSTGGTINLVSKLPTLRRSIAGSLTGGTAGMKRGTVDVNLPLGDTIAVRVNALAHDSDFAGREVVQNRRWGLAPSISFGMGTPTRYSFGYFYMEQDNISDYGIPWVPVTNNVLVEHRDRPAPVPRETFYGFLDRDKEKLRSDLFTARFEHDFNDNLSVRNQFRYGYSRRDSIATPPRFANNNSTTINRELRSWVADDDIFDNQTDFNARFKTGSIEHSAVFGTSLAYEKNHRVLRTGPNSTTTLLNPNPHDEYTGTIVVNPLEPNATASSFAGYLFDTIHLDKRWQLVGGIRWDYFSVEGQNVSTTVTPNVYVPLNRVDKILSGRAALVFKPVEFGTLYASFGTSANPSLEGLLYSPADARLDPEETLTYEAGTKWDLLGNRLLLSGAVFSVRKTNARTPGLNPGDPPTLDGDVLLNGIELSATGNITRNWQIFSGYTLLDSEIVESNAFTLVNGVPIYEQGKEMINTPRNSFNLWTTYRLDRFFFGGGPRFVGKRFGNNINTRLVDSYWVADAMMSYRLTKNIDLRLNINNIADKYYIDRIGGGHIVPGAGRSILVSSGFSF
ncbi:MAG TPA: TonB-dependent siderophore receptor [Pyrinomonadaceae bacterium]|nr:TonB-dependent siderophore receptor [Pyrinomonadaceae bacterium]